MIGVEKQVVLVCVKCLVFVFGCGVSVSVCLALYFVKRGLMLRVIVNALLNTVKLLVMIFLTAVAHHQEQQVFH